MGTCLSAPRISRQEYNVLPAIDTPFNVKNDDPKSIETFNKESIEQFVPDDQQPISRSMNYDKLSWNKGTPILAPVGNNKIARCVVLKMKMVDNKPGLKDKIAVKFPHGRINVFERCQLRSYPSYQQNLRKLSPGCTIEIYYKSQWILCCIEKWTNDNKSKFSVVFEVNKQLKTKEIARYSNHIRCCDAFSKLSANLNVFVFAADINQWCYGRIQRVINSENKNSKWLDLDIFEVYYCKNGKCYRKYVNQFSTNIALMNDSVHNKYKIKDEHINKSTAIHYDVIDLKFYTKVVQLFVKNEIECAEMYDDIASIMVEYIGFNYRLVMYVESQTYALAMSKRNTNLTPNDSAIHYGMNLLNSNSNATDEKCALNNVRQKPEVTHINQLEHTKKQKNNKNKISKYIKNANKNNPYKSNKVKEIQKCFKISRKLTAYASEHIAENISNLYYYMLNINALQFNNNAKQNKIKVFNYNFHDRETNEILYGIATRDDSRDFEWCMEHKLFLKQEILSNNEWNLQSLCFPSFDSSLLVNAIEMKCILKSVMRYAIFKSIIENTTWKNVKVFHGITDKSFRMVLQITQQQFKKQIIGCYENDMSENKDIDLVPMLIMNDNCDVPYVEYLHVTQIRKNGMLFNIGISLRCLNGKVVIVGGIHLNENYILNQCQLVDGCGDYECIRTNRWIFDDVHIGNPDDLQNKLNAKDKLLKEKINIIKKWKCQKGASV